ncbi:hypothetical protein HHI36_022812 [Cryptolaemus montrouzieri]|uniref:Uncharacterized protein n=1 Tax=Cryptolaemus montrouzieri TaxID=559131 RepID=A0ABD2PEN1_9CUCU
MDNNSKKADPGWNDPPMLNYSTSNPPPKSRISNKRVAFPLSSSSTTVLSPKVSSSNVCSSTAHAIEDDSYLEQKTFSNFNVLLESIENDDVLGKIEIMKNMWRTGLLSIDIKKIYMNSQIV